MSNIQTTITTLKKMENTFSKLRKKVYFKESFTNVKLCKQDIEIVTFSERFSSCILLFYYIWKNNTVCMCTFPHPWDLIVLLLAIEKKDEVPTFRKIFKLRYCDFFKNSCYLHVTTTIKNVVMLEYRSKTVADSLESF